MKTIYKYEWEVRSPLKGPQPPPEVHEGAQWLHFEREESEIGFTLLCWARVDDKAPVVPSRLVVVGTGWEFSDEMKYLTTVRESDYLIWHIFEEPGREGEE